MQLRVSGERVPVWGVDVGLGGGAMEGGVFGAVGLGGRGEGEEEGRGGGERRKGGGGRRGRGGMRRRKNRRGGATYSSIQCLMYDKIYNTVHY